MSARVETHLNLRDLQLKLKEHNRQLEQSNAELHKLQALRDNLTHMIIHDLKGPLTGMTSCLELLHDESTVVTESRREIVATAEQCGAAMLGMIDDMLAVSRLESGQMPLALQPNNLQELVRQSISSLGATLHDRPLELNFPSQDVVVRCDADLIRRVLVNLLSNADRYSSDDAPIRIQVREAADYVHVAIRDKGEGIPPQFRAAIFDKFCQLDDGGKRRPHSSGLGLTFCREAITAHGGTIGVNSEVGGGSEFWFELPRLTDD